MEWLSALGIVLFFITNSMGALLICLLINKIGNKYDEGISGSQ